MHTLTASGLYLRPFEERDIAAFAAAARESTASVGKWMPWCHAQYSEQEARDWFEVCQQHLLDETAFEFGVFDAAGGELLGGAGLNMINRQHNLCNLGYWVRQSRQRQGVARRVVAVLSAFGFETLAFTRIEIVVAQGNQASERVARASGAQFECVARNRLMIRGEPVAASVFSLVPAGQAGVHPA
ncbi:GNAT family N-acetyltransferase [Rhodoferax sp.]|uniref:GNAT family N-acetyltransferase n=1 Tax=Rhodoferax sp. TaxID=50421 RepID=UPI00277377A9|nr:GNAT family protein [Rhodoferax sp.]